MTDKLFKRLVEIMLEHAEDRRDEARRDDDSIAGDEWSAIAGLLDNIRQRFRK